MDVKVYSASDVIMTFGGAVVSGWDTISVSRDNPSFKTIQGIRNKNARSQIKNTAATITVVMPSTSDTNSLFSQIMAFDEATGAGRLEVMVRDVMGGEVFSSSEAYITKPADRKYESETSDRVWELKCLTSSTEQVAGGLIGTLMDVFNINF